MNRLNKFWMTLMAASGIVVLAGCAHHRETVYESHTVYHEVPTATAEQPPPPIPPATTTYRYYYYPDQQVYFDPVERVYWWREGDTWKSAHEVPSTVQLRERVVIEVPEAEPWHHHEIIVKEHPPRNSDSPSVSEFKLHRERRRAALQACRRFFLDF